jgi:hypothetical protein
MLLPLLLKINTFVAKMKQGEFWRLKMIEGPPFFPFTGKLDSRIL